MAQSDFTIIERDGSRRSVRPIPFEHLKLVDRSPVDLYAGLTQPDPWQVPLYTREELIFAVFAGWFSGLLSAALLLAWWVR